jgi:hypothetical protein
MKKQLPIILALAAAAAAAYFFFFRKKTPARSAGSGAGAGGGGLAPIAYNSPQSTRAIPAKTPSITSQLAQTGVGAAAGIAQQLLKGLGFGSSSGGAGSAASAAPRQGPSSAPATDSTGSSGGSSGSNITLTNVSSDALGFDFGSSDSQAYSDTSGSLPQDQGVSSQDIPPPNDGSGGDLPGFDSAFSDGGGDTGGDLGP